MIKNFIFSFFFFLGIIIISLISSFSNQLGVLFSLLNFASLEIDVSLHLGSLIAILIYFRKDLITIFKNKKLLYLIIFGSIPLIIIGYVLHSLGIVYLFRNINSFFAFIFKKTNNFSSIYFSFYFADAIFD